MCVSSDPSLCSSVGDSPAAGFAALSICQFGVLCPDMSSPQLLENVHFVAYINMMGARRNVDLSVCLARKMMYGVIAWGFTDLLSFDLAQWRIPDAKSIE